MHLGVVIVREHSRACKVPELRFTCARRARSESGLVCRLFLFLLRPAPPFFRSCDSTSKTTRRSGPAAGSSRQVAVSLRFISTLDLLVSSDRANVVSGRHP